MFCSKQFKKLFLFLAVSSCLAMHVQPGEASNGGVRAAPVVVKTAEMRLMAPLTQVAGSVVSRDDALLASEIAGSLRYVADVGDVVKVGAVVARVDDVLIKADVAEAEAEVNQKQASLIFLKKEVERLSRLAKQSNAAQTQLDETMAERDVTTGELAAAKARLRIAKERLARSQIRAPFSGVVVQRLKRVGEWVSVGDEVVQLVGRDDLEVEAAVPLKLRAYLPVGTEVEIRSDESVGKARIRAIVSMGDPTSRLMSVKLDITKGDWVVGQPLRVALPTAISKEVLAVPRDALVLRRSGTSIYVVGEENKAMPVSVEIGLAAGNFIEVRGNVKPGDQVVTRGNERLRPGQTVQAIGGGSKKGGAAH